MSKVYIANHNWSDVYEVSTFDSKKQLTGRWYIEDDCLFIEFKPILFCSNAIFVREDKIKILDIQKCNS